MEPFMTKQVFKLSALIVFLIGVFLCVKMNTRGIEDMLDNGDIAAIEKQIKNGAPVNAKSKFGVTPLHVAALNNRYELVNKLISKKADVNAKTSTANFYSLHTPLHFASRKSANLATVKLLIDSGADLEARDGLGATPLHHSLIFKAPELAEELIRMGADISACSNDKKTPLHRAAGKKFYSVVELLIKKGADPNARDGEGLTSLHEAVLENDAQMIKLLLNKGANVNEADNNGDTALHMAVSKEKFDAFKELLNGRAAVNSANKNGSTPLHSAIYYKDSSYCELLLKNGADPSIKDKHGATPISELETFNKPQMLQLLKQKTIKK